MPVTPAALAHAEDLADFVAASPSSYHAAVEVARRLEESGFTRLHEEDEWPLQPGGRFVVVRDGAAIAWVVPSDAATTTPVQIFGAHTDSPGSSSSRSRPPVRGAGCRPQSRCTADRC